MKRPAVLGMQAALVGAIGAAAYAQAAASGSRPTVEHAGEDAAATAPVVTQLQGAASPQRAEASSKVETPAVRPRAPGADSRVVPPRQTQGEVLPAGYYPGEEGDVAEAELTEPVELGPAEPAAPAGFNVQVASFPTRESAEKLAAQLVARGLPARAAPYGFASGKWWYSVRLGPFSSRVEAERHRLALSPGERTGALVLPRSRGAHFVQFASLRSRESAERLASRLSSTGHQLRVDTVSAENREKWHCVRIGPFDDAPEAESFRKLLSERDGIEGVVVPYQPRPLPEK